MAVARCAHADCGRFVKADETWCAKHKTGAVFDILRSAAEGAKADDGPLCGDPTCEGPSCRQEAIDTWNEQRAANARALFRGDESLPHHADMASGKVTFDYVPEPELEAAVKGGTSGPHETTLIYADAANDLARGKHRKDRPRKRRWWQRRKDGR